MARTPRQPRATQPAPAPESPAAESAPSPLDHDRNGEDGGSLPDGYRWSEAEEHGEGHAPFILNATGARVADTADELRAKLAGEDASAARTEPEEAPAEEAPATVPAAYFVAPSTGRVFDRATGDLVAHSAEDFLAGRLSSPEEIAAHNDTFALDTQDLEEGDDDQDEQDHGGVAFRLGEATTFSEFATALLTACAEQLGLTFAQLVAEFTVAGPSLRDGSGVDDARLALAQARADGAEGRFRTFLAAPTERYLSALDANGMGLGGAELPDEGDPLQFVQPVFAGQTVTFREHNRRFNGLTTTPAIITRVHEDLVVNLMVLPDGGEPYSRLAVPFEETLDPEAIGRAWSFITL